MSNLSAFQSDDMLHMSLLGDMCNDKAVLGETMPVVMYRLFEYTMRETLDNTFGKEKSVTIFREAGYKAGINFAETFLDCSKNKAEFFRELQEKLKELKIGILRIESIDDANNMIVTITDDLGCSGLPTVSETVCNYDEGFLSGIFYQYYKKPFAVEETDCWAKGDRICRFTVHELTIKEELSEV